MKSPEFFSDQETNEKHRRIPKRESGISKIVGATSEEEKQDLEKIKEVFLHQESLVTEEEREKTPEELEMILSINQKIQKFVKEYGGEPLVISPENIHFLDEQKLTPEQKEFIKKQEAGAIYFPDQQAIVVYPQKSRLKMAQHLVHEILHFNAFQSLTKEKGELYHRRQGLRIWTEKKEGEYFYDLDEAITTELTKKFDKQYFQEISYLKDEFNNRESFINHLLATAKDKEEKERIQDIACAYTKITKKKDGSGEITAVIDSFYSYKEKREYLNALINEIYKKNSDRFNNRDEVFKVFTCAVFSGELSEIDRLIKRSLGTGSFRRIANETIGHPKKVEYNP